MFRATLVAAVFLAAVTTTADGATRAANGRARTVRPLTIVNTRALDFGTIVRGTTAGTVTINANTDARTRGGGVVLAGGTPGAARFTVTGTPDVNAVITLGPRPLLTRVSGTETMAVTALTMNGGRTRRIPATGTLLLGVGGRLAIAANQRDGAYLGSFAVTVDYP